MTKRIYISDCEGPISKNDNAYELAEHFIPNGGDFFKLLSRYDDVLADVVHRMGYSAGYTLKLIVPFLVAYGATQQNIMDHSRKRIRLLKDAKISLQRIRTLLPTYIVSTSYSPYIQTLCEALDFPLDHTYSTQLHLNRFDLDLKQKKKLQKIRERVEHLKPIEIPDNVQGLEDLPETSKATIEELNQIFWSELADTPAGKIIENIQPIGSKQKCEAVVEITENESTTLGNVLYVGDSITDMETFQMVKLAGGVAISLNGNQYALRNAEYSILSSSMEIIVPLTKIFVEKGREGVQRFFTKSMSNLIEPQRGWEISIITQTNRSKITEQSTAYRKKVRGEEIAILG